jgi:hypothetical protein
MEIEGEGSEVRSGEEMQITTQDKDKISRVKENFNS